MMERGRRKTRTGVVIGDKMDKTRIVEITRSFRHPLYDKVLRRRTKFYVHDEKNESRAGDQVRIMETRPLSKLKRWRLVEVVKKPKEA
jgi:small subunit ribosomal protein S17